MMGQVLGTVASDKIINVMDEWMNGWTETRWIVSSASFSLSLSLSFSLSRSRGGERRRGGRRVGRRTERASAFRRYARDETGNERPDDETAESERVCRADRR